MPAVVFCTAFNPSQQIREIVSANPLHSVLMKPVKRQLMIDTIRDRLGPPGAPPGVS